MNARRSNWAEDIWVVEARGRLDAGLAPELEAQLNALLASGHARIVVDFGRVSYISSSGLKVLLVAMRAARRQGGDIRLCAMSERVRDVFTLSGFHKIFAIHATEQDAAAAFAGGEVG